MDRLSKLSMTLLLTAFLAGACGGSDSTGPDGGSTDQTEEPAELDFSAVEGSWAGPAVEASGIPFDVEANLEAGAKRARTVGSVRYSTVNQDPACLGTWIAESVDFPVFTVKERITDGACPDGVVELRLDEEAGELRYSFTPITAEEIREANGTLTRVQ